MRIRYCASCKKTSAHTNAISPVFFGFLFIQDNSDIKIECYSEDRLRSEKICNVSAPFMRAKSQVRLHIQLLSLCTCKIECNH